MAQDLAERLSKSTPTPWLKPLLDAVGDVNGKPVLMRGRVVKPEHSRWIIARLADLDAGLESDPEADEAEKSASLTKLNAALGNPAIPETFADVRAEVYLDALADIPAWAVDAAAMRWIRGDGLDKDDNPVFVPKPVQLIRIARDILRPFLVERDQLRNLLACAKQEQIESTRLLPAFSRPWWWAFHDFVVLHRDTLRRRDSAASQHLKSRIDLAVSYAIGWPVEPEKRDEIETEAQALVQVLKDSPEAEALRAHYRRWNIEMPLPAKADWIFAPRGLLDQFGDLRPNPEPRQDAEAEA